jgi:hypothetical protein
MPDGMELYHFPLTGALLPVMKMTTTTTVLRFRRFMAARRLPQPSLGNFANRFHVVFICIMHEDVANPRDLFSSFPHREACGPA